MTSLDVKGIRKNLGKKGFRIKDGSKHIKITYIYNNKDSGVTTAMSHSHTDISSPLITKMSRDLKVTKNDFIKLISCTMSEEEYKKQLLSNGYIS